MGKMKKLFFLPILSLVILMSCGGENYSVILSPQNLQKHLSENLATYSENMGKVRKISKNVFQVSDDCWTQSYECPISNYVKKFYSFYCTKKGGTLNGMKFLKERLSFWNKKLDEETEKLHYPEYYKRATKGYVITPSDLIEEYPQLACYIPSKEFFMVSYSYNCFRENRFWVRCPYTINVADFSLDELEKALEKAYKKELSIRKTCIERSIDYDKTIDVIASYFDLSPLCGFYFFSFSSYISGAKAEFTFENPTNKSIGVTFNQFGLIGKLPGYKDKYTTLVAFMPNSKFLVTGNCEEGKNMTVWIKPGGRCTIFLENLAGNTPILYSLLDKRMDIYMVFNGKLYPAKKVSLYEARVMEENLRCQEK